MLQAQETTAAPRAAETGPRPSMTTNPPFAIIDLGPQGQLAIRQESLDFSTVTCGYYSWTDSWWPWECISATGCNTIGDHFGCLGTVYTKCYASDDFHCASGNTVSPRELCCNFSTEYPACVTGIKSDDGKELTAYNCGKDIIEGEISIYNTSPTDEPTTTETSSTDTTLSTSSISSSGDVESSASSSIPSQSPGGDNNDGSDTPVGAIVGGVVGGVALLALIGFGIWFIAFHKRRAAKRAEAAESEIATMPSPQPPMQFSTPPPQAYPPVYQPVVSGTPPVGPGSPQPDYQRQSYQDGFVATDHSQGVPKSDYQTPDRTELPTDRARDSGSPVELQ